MTFPSSDVPSEEAEKASAEIMQTLAAYLRGQAMDLPTVIPERLAISRANSDGSGNSAIVRIVATAEHFCTEKTKKRLQATLPANTEMQSAALAAVERQVDTSWPSRRDAWKRWYGIETGQASPISRFMAFVEARNAVMHGGGHLTGHQLKGDGGAAVRKLLANIHLGLQNDRLHIRETNVRECAVVSRSMVRWLDRQLDAAPDRRATGVKV